MSEAAHQPSPAAPEASNTPTEPQDQAPAGTSQEYSSPTAASKTVSEFHSSAETLRPSEEIQKEEGGSIGDHIKIGTPPAPSCPLPRPSCSEARRATEDIHTEPGLQTSSLGQNEPLANGHPEMQAERMTSNTAEFKLDQEVWFLDGIGDPSNRYHQCFEDGMRTPPRRLTPEEYSDPSLTSGSSFNRCQKRRQRLFDAGKASLFYTLTRSNGKTQPKTAVLNLVALQRMNIHGLQAGLARYAAMNFLHDSFDFDESEDRQTLLNLYCKCFGPVLVYLLTRSR